MTNDLKIATINDLRKVDGMTKYEYLRRRHEWLGKVRVQEKEQEDRHYNKVMSFKYRTLHKDKVLAYRKKYYSRPAVKKRVKEYYNRPEVKQKLRQYWAEYRNRPEVKQKLRQYWAEYHNRPEVKTRRLEYSRRPEVKEKLKEYQHSEKGFQTRREWREKNGDRIRARRRELYALKRAKQKV